PPVFGPNPAITRPRTGQRKLDAGSLASLLLGAADVSPDGSGVVGAAMRAFTAGSALTILGAGGVGGRGMWGFAAGMVSGVRGAPGGLRRRALDAVRTGAGRLPGTTKRCPTRSRASGARLLTRAISRRDLP